MSIAHSMRSAAREIFLHALSEASIEKAFDRHVQLPARRAARVR